MKYLFIYLVIINLISLLAMWTDKQKAVKGAYRIPEKTLFLLCIIGGAAGGTAGMFLFRHKTRHWYFRYGFPLLALAWAAALIYLYLLR